MTRDIAFLVLLVLLIVAALVLFLKVSAVLDSAKRSLKNVEDVVSTVSDKVVRPAAAGSRVASGAGKAAAFLLGLARRRRKGDSSDGEQ